MPTISDYSSAREVLRDNAYLNDRISPSFEAAALDKSPATNEVRDFYRGWLMYQDGELHRANRAIAAATMDAAHGMDLSARDELLSAAGTGRLDAAASRSIALRFHRQIFGLSNPQQDELLEIIPPILAVVHDGPDRERVALARPAIDKVRSWFAAQSFAALGVLATGRALRLPEGLALNLVVDSLEPLISAASSVLWRWGDETMTNKSFVADKTWLASVLRDYPPFRYIGRVDSNRRPDRAVVDVNACNAGISAGMGLSFGAGVHYCLGARLSLLCLDGFLSDLNDLAKTHEVQEVRGALAGEESGVTAILDLEIRLRRARV